MGLFDFLWSSEGKKQSTALVVKNYEGKVDVLNKDLDFKKQEIQSLYAQNGQLLKQNDELIKTIQKLTGQLIEKLEERHVISYPEVEKEAKKVNETDDALQLCEQGHTFLRQRKYKEALEKFEEALDSNSKYKEAMLGKALALHKMGKKEKALEWCDKALEADKHYKDAWLNKGVILDDMNKHKEAIKCFDKVIYLGNGVKH